MPQPAADPRPLTREEIRAAAATHTWVGAAELPLSASQAHTADLRAAVTIKADTKVHVIDAYCSRCKRNYEAVLGQRCPAKDTRTNEHLRGGPIGERKKRGRQPRMQQPAPATERAS